MKIKYKAKRFSSGSLDIIQKANEIIEDLASQGYDLTLRQLYYQFVSKALIPNQDKQYKRLGSILNDARLAGLISWGAIVDRTRSPRSNNHWDSPSQIVSSCASQFRFDKWEAQGVRPEVWIEKDALVGVVSGVCGGLDVSYFSCRGYTSQSAMWRAAMRLRLYADKGQRTVIFHLGDHDPSGIDMTRDIRDRLSLFGARTEVKRIALNMDQVDQYNPPPNPTKLSDSRSNTYVEQFGYESWELDALEPRVIGKLIESAVVDVRDQGEWDRMCIKEHDAKDLLGSVASNWSQVVDTFG